MMQPAQVRRWTNEVEQIRRRVRRVRAIADERGGLAPAIALTAYARTEDRERALAAGFQVHLSKPFNPTAVVQVVARLLSASA